MIVEITAVAHSFGNLRYPTRSFRYHAAYRRYRTAVVPQGTLLGYPAGRSLAEENWQRVEAQKRPSVAVSGLQ
jgi:hypothetical protein